jgi:hypothetical protein
MTEQQLKEYAQEKSKSIVIRSYHEGNSKDERRPTTKSEAQIIENIIFGALLAIRSGRNTFAEVQAAKDTAEYTGNLFIPGMNGYDSIYNPIGDFCRENGMA